MGLPNFPVFYNFLSRNVKSVRDQVSGLLFESVFEATNSSAMFVIEETAARWI
jgi:hypothetical protein